jgi:hypothetical protein
MTGKKEKPYVKQCRIIGVIIFSDGVTFIALRLNREAPP